MSSSRFLILVPAAALLLACTEAHDPPGSTRTSAPQAMAVDRMAINDIRDAAISNALITQHTLFPYHFEAGRETLNELGVRDLDSLAAYYRGRPGDLNVRRGGVSDELYHARLQTVSDRLKADGVDVSRLKITDAPAGGSGMPSEQVVKILANADKSTASPGGASPVVSQNTPYEGMQTGVQEGSK
jgi:hypothetical protein